MSKMTVPKKDLTVQQVPSTKLLMKGDFLLDRENDFEKLHSQKDE